MPSLVTLLLASASMFLLLACGSNAADKQTAYGSLSATAESLATAVPTPDPTALSPFAIPPWNPPSHPNVTPDASLGEQIVLMYGCNFCHSTDGSALTGPTWQGLYGTQEAVEEGTTVLVDGAYIAESIKDPNARITLGFASGLMPTLGVEDEEILHIIEYMKSLRWGVALPAVSP